MSEDTYNATPHHQLIMDLRNCSTPKSEREHAAVREINKLEKRNKILFKIAEAVALEQNWKGTRTTHKVIIYGDTADWTITLKEFAQEKLKELENDKTKDN